MVKSEKYPENHAAKDDIYSYMLSLAHLWTQKKLNPHMYSPVHTLSAVLYNVTHNYPYDGTEKSNVSREDWGNEVQ